MSQIPGFSLFCFYSRFGLRGIETLIGMRHGCAKDGMEIGYANHCGSVDITRPRAAGEKHSGLANRASTVAAAVVAVLNVLNGDRVLSRT